MKLQSRLFRSSLLLSSAALLLGVPRASAQNKKGEAAASGAKVESVAKTRRPIRDDKNLEKIQEGSDFLRRRQEWFFKPRAFPIGFIPQGARERALQQKMQMSQRQGGTGLFAVSPLTGFAAPPLGPTSNWLSIGPQPTSSIFNPPFTSGRITALAVNPNNASNVYLGGADGGLWVTANGGSTWTPLTDNPPTPTTAMIPSVAVGAIAVDASTCGVAPSGICTTVYVATGEDNFGVDNVYGEGVLNCTVTAGAPPSAVCTQDSTFHTPSPLDHTRGGPNIGALAINPKTSGTTAVLLAGVRGRGTALQSGIYCSANGGSTWGPVFGISGIVGTDAVFASDGTAFVALGFPFGDAANNGIYKSSVPVSTCAAVTDLSMTPPGGTGSKWIKQILPAGTPAASLGRITLAIAPSAISTGSNAKIFAAIADATTTSSNFLGLLRTTNGGGLWTQLTDPLVSADSATNASFCSGQCFYDMALAVDPASPDVVFAGGSGQNPIIRTTNGTTTATWADVTAPTGTASVPHVDTHAFAFAHDGSKVWVGNDGGAWSSSSPNGTLSWNDLNGPAGTSTGALNLVQFYPGISIHPSNPGFSLGGSQDNGIQVDESWSNPAATALTWQDSGLPCDGGFTVIDPAIPSTSYGECEYIPSALLILASTFSGDGLLGNGFAVTNGIDGADRGSFIPPFVVDQKNSQTLYFGTCRVWQTKNAGVSWAAISPDVTTSSHPTTCPVPTSATQPTANLQTIAVALSSSSTIYVGSDEGEIEVTSDGGANWAPIVTATLPARAVQQIAVDPSNAAIAYAVFSGFGSCATFCDGKGHVFKTVNGTAGAATTWIDISGAISTTKLPDIPVNAIVIDPDDNSHNTLYIGTDIGAFSTTDGGVNWAPLGAANSMPNAQILALTLHDPSRTLRAATHGRGMWDLDLGPGLNTPALVIGKISPFSANAPGAATTLTVDGTGFTSSSVVMFGSTAKTPTSATATQLTAPLTTGDLAAAAVVQVTVKDGTSTSNAVPFTVLGQPPTITSVTPTSGPYNMANQIMVTGTNFSNNSVVLMNPDVGLTPLATTFNSATQLTATVPAAQFGSTNSVGVENQPPGGGITLTNPNANPPVVLPTFIVIAPPPANDNFASAINISSKNFSDTKDSSGATTQTADPAPPCSQIPGAPTTGTANTIWYKVVPTGTGTANIDTIGSSYDSVLSVWSGTSQTALTFVACNDDINPGVVLQSQLTGVTLSAGTTYYIMVSSFGALDPNPEAFGGKSVLNFSFTGTIGGSGGTVSTTTSLMASPTSLPAGGGSVTLTATVAGTGTGASPTGTVQFMNGSTALGTAQTCAAVSGAAMPTCKATLTTTLAFLVPPIAPRRAPPGLRVQPIGLIVAVVLLLLSILGLQRIPPRYRRVYACVAFLLLAGLVAGFVGCSKNYGGGGGNLHYDSITAVYSGDATYSGSTSTSVQITIQ